MKMNQKDIQAFVNNETPASSDEKREKLASQLKKLMDLSGEHIAYCWVNWDELTEKYL